MTQETTIILSEPESSMIQVKRKMRRSQSQGIISALMIAEYDVAIVGAKGGRAMELSEGEAMGLFRALRVIFGAD
jgi:hypothetical protein